jgi:hypothetical protein
MNTGDTSETFVPMYATICITQYDNPQTQDCLKFKNPVPNPDCHLVYEHDSLSQAEPGVQLAAHSIRLLFIS